MEQNIEKKEVKRVVTDQVTIKKKTNAQRIAGAFVSEDLNNIKEHIIYDTLIPAIKKGIYDVATEALHRLFFNSAPTSSTKSYGPATKVTFTDYSNNNRFATSSTRPVESTSTYDYGSIIFSSARDAEAVLAQLYDMSRRYGLVSVADFYEMCGKVGKHTDYKYGWKNFNGVQVYRTGNGYSLNLPKALPFD